MLWPVQIKLTSHMEMGTCLLCWNKQYNWQVKSQRPAWEQLILWMDILCEMLDNDVEQGHESLLFNTVALMVQVKKSQ